MDDKTLNTLEYFKILERLASYCAFEASAEKARLLRPTRDLFERVGCWLKQAKRSICCLRILILPLVGRAMCAQPWIWPTMAVSWRRKNC